MDIFLRGFADELMKVADFTGGPSTGIRGGPAPRPANRIAPTDAALRSIPVQKMESPARTTPQTWRPSPGYRPSTAGDPVAVSPTKPHPSRGGGKGGSKGPAKDVRPPWESVGQTATREKQESDYNARMTNKAPVMKAPATVIQGPKTQPLGAEPPTTFTPPRTATTTLKPSIAPVVPVARQFPEST